jgi:hypothetical protein
VTNSEQIADLIRRVSGLESDRRDHHERLRVLERINDAKSEPVSAPIAAGVVAEPSKDRPACGAVSLNDPALCAEKWCRDNLRCANMRPKPSRY